MNGGSTLLLSNVSPSGAYVGSQFLRPLVQAPPPVRCCITACGPAPETIADPLPNLPEHPVSVPLAPNIQPVPSLRARLTRWQQWRQIRRQSVGRIVDEAVSLGKAHGVDRVWAILHEPAVVLSARQLAHRLGVPLYTTVWDPQEYVLRSRGGDRVSLSSVMNEFGAALAESKACTVMSEAMAEEYRQRYGARCVILRLGIPAERIRQPLKAPQTPGIFRLIFAGHMYCEQEWLALLRALEHCDYRVGGREIQLVVVGGTASLRSSRPCRIEFLGRRTASETLELVAAADGGYLPYWFDEEHAYPARLSFPTKLSTYLGAGIPVLYHGPYRSSVTEFLSRYNVGVAWTSADPSGMTSAMERLCDDTTYSVYADAISSAVSHEFTSDVMLQRYEEFMGSA